VESIEALGPDSRRNCESKALKDIESVVLRKSALL